MADPKQSAWTPVDETASAWTPVAEANPIAKAEEPGFLDKEIKLDSYKAATLSGVQSIGRGLRTAGQGALEFLHPPSWDEVQEAIKTSSTPGDLPMQILTRRMGKGVGETGKQATQIPAAIHDINQSPDPLGTYAKAAQETAGQGAGQAITALVTEGAVKGTMAAKNALPSSARAGAALQEIKSTVGNVPINSAQVGDAALELYTQAQRGATLPKAVNNLVRRMTAPDAPPLTYEEAKDFQSNISSLSANEKMNLKPNTVRLVGKLNAELKSALEDAADTAGKGEQFTQAMKEYHQAMKLRGMSDEAISYAWKAALGALGVREVAKILGGITQR